MELSPWNNLPSELLQAIAKGLKTKTEVSRLRAVCRSWRLSIPQFDKTQLSFPISIIVQFPYPVDSFFLTITESVVYCLVLPPDGNSDAYASTSNTRGWVVKLGEAQPGDQTRMLHPLSPIHIKRVPRSVFPKMVNLLQFRVYELAKVYTMYHSDNSVSDHRVAVSLNPDWPAVMVAAAGKLYYSKLGLDQNPKCTMVVTDATLNDFKDVTFYEGKFYAVCHNGTTVMVDSSLETTLIASSIGPNHGNGVRCIKSLVESSGELLLVERYPSYNNFRYFRPDKFKVYRLNAPEKQWVKMESLGNQILCVGDNKCCFTVAAEDFPGCQTNCIYFSDPCFTKCYRYNSIGRRFKMGGFNLDDGSFLPLPFDPGSWNMFCPPSTWPMPSSRKRKQPPPTTLTL